MAADRSLVNEVCTSSSHLEFHLCARRQLEIYCPHIAIAPVHGRGTAHIPVAQGRMPPHQLMALPKADLPLGGDLQGGIACNTLHGPTGRGQLAAVMCAWELIAQRCTPVELSALWLCRPADRRELGTALRIFSEHGQEKASHALSMRGGAAW